MAETPGSVREAGQHSKPGSDLANRSQRILPLNHTPPIFVTHKSWRESGYSKPYVDGLVAAVASEVQDLVVKHGAANDEATAGLLMLYLSRLDPSLGIELWIADKQIPAGL